MNKQNKDWSKRLLEITGNREEFVEKASLLPSPVATRNAVDRYDELMKELELLITNLLKEQLDRVNKEVIGEDWLTSDNSLVGWNINEVKECQRQKLEEISKEGGIR